MFFQTDLALEKYRSLADRSPQDSISRYAANRLREIKHQTIFLYNDIDEVDEALVGEDDHFYYLLRNDPKKLNIDSLKKCLSPAQFERSKIELNLQVGIYYMEVEYDLDSCWYYLRGVYDQVNNAPELTTLEFDVNESLVEVCSYKRLNLLALGLVNDLNMDIQNRSLSNQYLSSFMNRRAKVWIRLDSIKQARKDIKISSRFLKEELCSPLTFQTLTLALYIAKNTESDSLISLMMERQNYCNNKLVNVFRNIGQEYEYKNVWDKAKINLEKAKTFENEIAFRSDAQYESICYLLSSVYENTGNYSDALKVYFENKKKFPEQEFGVRVLFDQFDELNDFVALERFGSIYLTSWKDNKTKRHLDTGIKILKKAEELMNQSLTAVDESTVLKYFNYKTSVFESLGQAYFYKYKLTHDDQYKNLVIETFSKMNNLLLQKEWNEFNDERFGDKVLIQKKRELQKRINEIGQKGFVDNFELSKIQWDLLEVSDSMNITLENRDIFYLKSRMDVNELQNNLKPNQSLLNYILINNQLFVSHVKKESTAIYNSILDTSFFSKLKDLKEFQSRQIDTTATAYQSLAFELFEVLFPQDLFPKLESELIFVLDTKLTALSFESLVNYKNQSVSFSELEYLINQKDHYYLPSDQLLKQFNSRSVITKFSGMSFTDRETIDADPVYLNELPYAIKELKMFNQYISDFNLFTGKRSTVKNFLNILESSSGYLHLATHSVAKGEINDGTKLYFRNNDYSLDSLYNFQLLGVKSDMDLVYLASCDSADGEFKVTEGIFDFKRYLLMCGVKSVISSNWKVNDYASSELTKLFLINDLNLNQAKREFLKTHSDLCHPYYWSGVVN